VILKMTRFCAFVITSEAIDTEEEKERVSGKAHNDKMRRGEEIGKGERGSPRK